MNDWICGDCFHWDEDREICMSRGRKCSEDDKGCDDFGGYSTDEYWDDEW